MKKSRMVRRIPCPNAKFGLKLQERTMSTILIADDEKDLVELLKFLMEKEGFKVATARNGREALEKIGLMPSNETSIKPDLLILDIMMPEIDGYTVQSKMMEDNLTRSIPIIILTAKGQMRELFGMATNVVAYIEKPFDPQMLRDKVLEILRKK
ncbi:MAG TPA: two-component system response regulator [Elusimicrobia bacterium]|nr:two-component system response regulator [Elusimicrobiota bacterium]